MEFFFIIERFFQEHIFAVKGIFNECWRVDCGKYAKRRIHKKENCFKLAKNGDITSHLLLELNNGGNADF